MIYDWSNENSQKIEWAAFFSDCEHEVLEVTGGNRVTLTYNLFMSPIASSAISASPVISADPEMYPLHRKAQALLQDPEFMKNGIFLSNILYTESNGSQAEESGFNARTLMPILMAS